MFLSAEVSDGLLSPRSTAAELSDDLLSPRISTAERSEDSLSPRSSTAERSEALLRPRSWGKRWRAAVALDNLSPLISTSFLPPFAYDTG